MSRKQWGHGFHSGWQRGYEKAKETESWEAYLKGLQQGREEGPERQVSPETEQYITMLEWARALFLQNNPEELESSPVNWGLIDRDTSTILVPCPFHFVLSLWTGNVYQVQDKQCLATITFGLLDADFNFPWMSDQCRFWGDVGTLFAGLKAVERDAHRMEVEEAIDEEEIQSFCAMSFSCAYSREEMSLIGEVPHHAATSSGELIRHYIQLGYPPLPPGESRGGAPLSNVIAKHGR